MNPSHKPLRIPPPTKGGPRASDCSQKGGGKGRCKTGGGSDGQRQESHGGEGSSPFEKLTVFFRANLK